MKKSVNKPWAISDKYRNKYGVIWSDMDFEINPKISTYQFNEASFVAGAILFLSMIIYFIIDNLSYQGSPDITT